MGGEKRFCAGAGAVLIRNTVYACMPSKILSGSVGCHLQRESSTPHDNYVDYCD